MFDNEAYLKHYGVMGMKWGVRKDEYRSLSRGERKNYRKKTRTEKIQSKTRARKENAELTIETASKGQNDVLIKTKTSAADIYPTVMTGKEFVDHLIAGGAFDVASTQVFMFLDTPKGKKIEKEFTPRFEKINGEYEISYLRKDGVRG